MLIRASRCGWAPGEAAHDNKADGALAWLLQLLLEA